MKIGPAMAGPAGPRATPMYYDSSRHSKRFDYLDLIQANSKK